VGSKKHLGASDLPRCAHLDLLDESRYQALLANPALLWLELRALPAQRVAVLDEFQRVHAVLNEVQRAIEGARRRFVLLGSSAPPAEDRRHEPAGWARGGANHVSAGAGRIRCQLAGLRAIREVPRLTRRILVYLGDRRLRTEDGIDVWPLDRLRHPWQTVHSGRKRRCDGTVAPPSKASPGSFEQIGPSRKERI